jgi:hypothetical protein
MRRRGLERQVAELIHDQQLRLFEIVARSYLVPLIAPEARDWLTRIAAVLPAKRRYMRQQIVR